MPYFYKLSDYYDNPEDWLNKVEFTIGDFIYGCETKNNTGSIYIFLIHDIYKLIESHPKNLKYEYFTKQAIPPEFIIFTKKKKIKNNDININGKLLHNPKRELREWFEKRLKKDHNNSYYIHITCIENLNSIMENGIYSEEKINIKNRIGNRVNSDNLSNNNLSYINSSISSLNKPLIYGKTPNKRKKSKKKKSKKNKSKKKSINKRKYLSLN